MDRGSQRRETKMWLARGAGHMTRCFLLPCGLAAESTTTGSYPATLRGWDGREAGKVRKAESGERGGG
ncbi:hypothetical protein L249_4432 [Ophiocordyceps polyrhachis-furcata BCC 54312]|uniref:Uncharacterized protein n=1 Tax=Ophiocordyceps polyrhachis-furcata BCC 54312 TaxID=1330021 RepID=A0A367L7I2_9HYPO|nr:hypothetical protein L249_4432 [Ophiocordyceps polyrhachis-furcata BCC 54312]